MPQHAREVFAPHRKCHAEDAPWIRDLRINTHISRLYHALSRLDHGSLANSYAWQKFRNFRNFLHATTRLPRVVDGWFRVILRLVTRPLVAVRGEKTVRWDTSISKTFSPMYKMLSTVHVYGIKCYNLTTHYLKTIIQRIIRKIHHN